MAASHETITQVLGVSTIPINETASLVAVCLAETVGNSWCRSPCIKALYNKVWDAERFTNIGAVVSVR